MKLPILLLVGFLTATLVGCGEENKLGRQSVSGTILLNGEPLPEGTILFAPKQPKGVSGGAEIVDGKFEIPEIQGLTSGIYAVRIYAADEEAEDVEPVLPGPGIKVKPEKIPLEYNVRSKLELTVADGPAVFDLDISGK